MINAEDILSLNYYNYGNAFSGSYKGMRYRIIKKKAEKDEEGNIIMPDTLHVSIWPEPFSYEKTEKTMITEKDFGFDEEGRLEVVAWLNASWNSKEWNVGFTVSSLKALRKEDMEEL